MNGVSIAPVYRTPLSRLPTSVVNVALTMSLERQRPVWHGRAMARRTTMAGGCFLTLCILGGLAAGIMTGNAMRGVLIGTAAGVVLALLVWLVDGLRHRPHR